MNYVRISTLAGAAALAISSPTMAQDPDPTVVQETQETALEMRAAQVVGVVNGEIDPETVFTDGFLAQVPVSQLNAIAQSLVAQHGAAIAVESLEPVNSTRAGLAIRMERTIARGGIAIVPGDDNRISELLFQTFEAIDDSPVKIETDLAALPGDVTWWFGALDGSAPILASETDEPMPLGSTFKLYVLAALAYEIAQGDRAWDDIVTLDDPRSFPSGMMQDWPENAPVTVQTLASLMISISDNTATDALIRLLGRDAVLQTLVASGHSAPQLNDPFLTTREMFLLKGGPDGRLEAYQGGNTELRVQILDGIETPQISGAEVGAAFAAGPRALDIEWFATAADLGNLFRYMRENVDAGAFDVMSINPSMPANLREKWAYAGYKGGSEPGVLNLTWLLTDDAGRDHALVLSWSNDTANLNGDALEAIAQRILALPPR